MKEDEYMCSGCGRIIGAEESLWVTATETICEDCHQD
jgi:DNA-directed RNA polymerase subunit RPC12/RpoP